MKKSFVLHLDSLEVLDKLSDSQCAQLFKACRDYNLGLDLDLDPVVDILFTQFKAQFKRDNEKYDRISNRNKLNGKKGGRPKQNPENPVGYSVTQSNPENPVGYLGSQENPEEPKKADSDSDSDSDSDISKDIGKKDTSKDVSKKTEEESVDFSVIRGFEPRHEKIIKDLRRKTNKKSPKMTQPIIKRLAQEVEKASFLGMTLDQCLEEWDYRGWAAFTAAYTDAHKSQQRMIQPSKAMTILEQSEQMDWQNLPPMI